MANQNPQRRDLRVAHKRPDSPLGSGGGHICHHAIPYNQLRDFWNRAVRDNLHDFSGTFLKPFAESVGRYPVAPGDGEGAANFLGVVTNLLRPVVREDVVHDETRPPAPGWGDVAKAYAWMPGNLFLGPGRPEKTKDVDPGRGRDPGPNFDTFASQCMTPARYAVVRAAQQAISAYLASPAPPAPVAGKAVDPKIGIAQGRACRAAGTALSAVARFMDVTPYNPKDWVAVAKKN